MTLSFVMTMAHYKSAQGGAGWRSVGGRECPAYATSNRAHLMPRDMIENEDAVFGINPAEAVEEKVVIVGSRRVWLVFNP